MTAADITYLAQSAEKLVLSAVFASLIGYEREMQGRPAGLRTHILVAVGSTLFTLASVAIVGDGPAGDRGRIAAQIVSGIGFLGAGTIIQQGSAVRGLTTAASLWAVSGIGLAIGVGGRMLGVATIACLVMLLTLSLLRQTERWLDDHRRFRELCIVVTETQGVLHKLLDVLDRSGVKVFQSKLTEGLGAYTRAFTIGIHTAGRLDIASIARALSEVPEVISVEWD